MSTEDQHDWSDWPSGVGRVILETVDSTMAEASRIAPEISGPTWVFAHRQTAGRGRRGRDWVDPQGNFAATLVMRQIEPAATLALRSFVASLALYDTMVATTGNSQSFSLKWPNDVLLNGGKLAGILLESVATGDQNSHLAVGIGINLENVPKVGEIESGAVRPVSLVMETGLFITPLECLTLLGPAYAKWEHKFSTYGFAPIREAWLTRAARLGQVITARTGQQELTGTFDTIDDAGQLILSTAKGRRAIPAADIYF